MSLTLDVFVSSPGDMAGEREIVAEVVAKLAQQPHVRRYCTLRAHFYEQMVPPVLASSAQAAVNTFMMDPARCDVMVCLLGRRLGTAVKDPELDGRTFRSGTEYEIVKAYESTKRPKPMVLLYHRSRSGAPRPATTASEHDVDAFLSEFKGDGARFKGIEPAPFEDADDLRAQLYTGLDAVVTGLVRAHVVRRWAIGAAAVAAALGAIGATYALASQVEKQRGAVALAAVMKKSADDRVHAEADARANQARAVLDAVSRGDWTPVEELDRVGCPAAAPLLQKLAEIDSHPAGHIRATVRALGKLAAGAAGERCGCPQLLSVVSPQNAVVKYSQATQRIVLEELRGLSCRNNDMVAR